MCRRRRPPGACHRQRHRYHVVQRHRSHESFGNATTHGNLSPQATLVGGSLNELCVGVPAKADVQSVLAAINVGVQDIPVLSSPQNQQCAENSTEAKDDEPLSHILDDISVLAGNGATNS